MKYKYYKNGILSVHCEIYRIFPDGSTFDWIAPWSHHRHIWKRSHDKWEEYSKVCSPIELTEKDVFMIMI